MSLSRQTTVRLLFTLFLVVLGIIALLLAPPAYAFENKAWGDVVVGSGETEPEVSTGVGDITVDGLVEGDVRSGKGDVEVNGEVEGDINAGFGDVEVNGPVGGEIEAGFGDVRINDRVAGDVDVGRGDVELGPDALVLGDVSCGSCEIRGNKDALQGAFETRVRPDMDHGPSDMEVDEPDRFGIPDLIGWFFAAAAFAACSVLLAVLAPGPLLAAARRAEESHGWSLLFGVASVPAVVVLAVILAVSIIGIPLLLLLAPAYLAFVFFGALVAAYFVGRRVVFATRRYHAGNALAAAVGAVILAVVYLIPVLGNLLVYAFALLGTGASILALFSRRRPPAYPSYEAYVQDRRNT
jgi:cytoskeletal protein CcmA (bactofilin family)